MRVKPTKDNLNYGITLNLDSAQESLGSARPLGVIKGRQQFRDFVGNKGDGLGDYYSFSVEHPSLLQYSLSQFDPGGDANVEILDSNGNAIAPDQFSGKVGGKELQPGQYYLRVTAANNTNTNYTLTMQMAEELGTYTGRHEYNDRLLAGKYREAFYRLKVDAPAEELHLALRNLSGDANVELLRNDGSGIVNSTLISPVVGSNQSGTQAEYKAYANVTPGDYLVRVYMPDSSVPWTKYDLVMNLDQAGEDWSHARNLGMLTDIAQSSDYQFSDFIGADQGDGSDVYKFQVGDYGLVHLALKPPAGDAAANMLAANMRLQDESGKDVDLLNITPRSDFNYAAAYLQPGKSYYLTVSSNPGMVTNYNLVINPVSEETINGFRVSGDLYKVFAQYRESIGSPTSAVTNQSSGVSYQVFQNGLIISSSYGTYPVWWGIKDAYLNKYGSLSGKLGAPTGMEYDWNGGKRQDFAGGYITWKNGSSQAYKYDGSPLYLRPGSGGGKTSPGVTFADPRIQKIYKTAFDKFVTSKQGEANPKIKDLEDKKRQYQQDLNDLLARINTDQRNKIETELNGVENDGKKWVEENVAKPVKNGIGIVANDIIQSIDAAVSDEVEEYLNKISFKDELKMAEKTLKDNVEKAKKWLEGKIDDIRGEIDKLIEQFVKDLEDAYKTGAEINGEIERLATTLKENISAKEKNINNWIDQVKEQVTSPLKDLEKIRWGDWNFYKDVVEKFANDLTTNIKNKVNDVGDIAERVVTTVKSLAQIAVAEISSKVLGDETGKLYNQINGIDQQIIDIRNDVKKAISEEATHILNVVREIEALLTDSEERNRMLDLLAKNGYNNVEEAHKFVVNNLEKIREQIAEETRKILELAKKNFADLVRTTVQRILGSNPKRQVNGNLRLDKIIEGVADIKAGYTYELEQEEEETEAGTTTFYSVTTTPSLGIGISEGSKLETAWETGVQAGHLKIAGQNVETEVNGRIEGDIVLGTEIKYKFDSSNDDDMTRLGVWAFRELPTPFDSIDPILNTLIRQNFDSGEIFLNPSLTGEIVAPWGGGAIALSSKVAGGVRANEHFYSKTELGLDSEGSIRGKGAGTELAKLGINVSGKLSFIAESSLDKLEKISIELEVPPLFANNLNFLIGGTPLNDKINDFNSEVKDEGKAVGNVKFIININDPFSLLASYSSVLMNVLKLSKSNSESEFGGDLYETIGGVITALKQTHQSVEVRVNAEATQVVYLNAEANIKIGGRIGFSNTLFQNKVLYP